MVIKKKTISINDQIDSPTVRVIDHEGQQIGVITKHDALQKAEAVGLDLVEVSPNANPPVCKIMDFGKYKYEMAKKDKETKKKQHVVVTKEIRLRPKIEEHDFEFKLRHARKFLESGHRVKATVMFRGRENAHREYGARVLDRFTEALEDVAKVEKDARLEGGQLIMFFTKK